MIRQTAAGIWIIDGDSHISRWIEEKGQLQHDYQTLPLILPEINEGDVVVDAGANIGDTTGPFLERVGASGAVYSFEPEPIAFECLRRNCQRAICDHAALGAVDGVAFIRGADEFSQNFGASYMHGAIGNVVRIKALDSAVDLVRCDFIKIDVEGYELNVLRGAEQTISGFKPKMAIELNEGALRRQGASIIDVLQWLHDHGYQCWPLNCPDRTQPLPQFDILATPGMRYTTGKP